MMRYLTIIEVLALHGQVIGQSGGKDGIRDLGLLESAIAQPMMTFGGIDLYVSIVDKAVALGFSLIMNHPFVDGNKRTGHAAMEVFLVLNGLEIVASVEEQERVILSVAAGDSGREVFLDWLQVHVRGR
ncbi:type II toxin-antitoxin system death-on-curing family toxin [Pseudanabaena sp. ABRG5-3]|uniref:type II toxin-antitoxin system death-on-curing family toxin n=1 Tax=Pseudanabaena sp. ABRG5-3 TaxID=685565 RepID=UPI001575CC9F